MKSIFSRHGLAGAVSLHLIALTLIFLGLPCVLRAQTLEHRYSFSNDGATNAIDSVGGTNWDGTLIGNAYITNNALVLPQTAGSTSDNPAGFVQLPDGIVTNDASITVEAWLTDVAGQIWAEAWCFGDSGAGPGNPPTGGTAYISLIPHSGANGFGGEDFRAAFNLTGGDEDDVVEAAGNTLPLNVEEYCVVTYNIATTNASLYLNGVLVGTATIPTNLSPSNYGATFNNFIGRDQFGGDPTFAGSFDELRIWNGVIPQLQIAASALVGPDVLVTNLTPTSATLSVVTNMVVTGTQQGAVTVEIAQTGTNELVATGDATDWTSGDASVLTVNSSGLISAVNVGATTVSAKVGGITATSASITVSPQMLEHRYSFVSDASDSVGGTNWNGAIVAPTTGGAATIGNGLFLPGNTVGGFGYSGYVSLPAGILTNTTSLTVECWATENQDNTWAELWDFGNSGSQNFGLIPYSGSGNTRVAFTPNNGEIDIDATALPTNSEQYIVVTYNNSTLIGSLYTNGVLDSTQTYPNITYAPGGIGGTTGTTNEMLGNDVYGDEQFDGTIYEFRIWNGAVSPLYIALSAAAGSSNVVTNLTPLSLTLTVADTNIIGSQIEQATVTGNFAVASNVTVTGAATNWTSSNPNVLTVSSSGLITGGSGGNATVSATVDGVTATSQSITVALTPPRITQEPSPVTAVVGESETLTVEALGGELSYQWYEGAMLIAGATTSSLTLSNLTFGQSGNYSVMVTNALGSTNSVAAALTVDVALLAHRYSFVSDASDSVGGPAWNGTIVAPNGGGAATIADGLNLPGNAGGGSGVSGYVALPSGILVGDDSVTVECWVTQLSPNGWATVWDFANDGAHNFEMCPYPENNFNNLMSADQPHGNELDVQSTNTFPTGAEQYVAVTYDNSTLAGNLYLNGAQVGTRVFPDATYAPGSIGGAGGTAQDWLGNDTYGDPQFDGTIYELRIWNGAVPQRQVAASALLGPTVLVTNLTPTSASVTAGPGVVITGTEQATINVTLAQTGDTNLVATVDATNWASSDPTVLAVNSSGLITGVGVGSATVSAMVAGVPTGNSGSITVTPQTLEHRYSFVSDASDSVGGTNWDGTIVAPATGAAATISNGLSLQGNTAGGFGYSGYVSLPSGILVGDTSLTIECWATQTSQNTWAELWDFGNNNNQTFGLIPFSGSGNTRVAFTPDQQEIDINANGLPTNSEQYIVVTYNNFTLSGSLYTNGVLDATQAYPDAGFAPGDALYDPGSFGGGTTENMLGNDVYGDEQFSGTVFELRIWNGAVSPLYIAVSAAAGPSNVVSNLTPLSLSVTVTNTSMVTPQTQQATVVGNFAAAAGVTVTGAATNWSSSSTNVLTVSSSGLITAVGSGSATVSATVDGDTATSAAITVTSSQVNLGLALSGTNVVLTWSAGTLLEATNLLGPWTTNSAAVSPFITPTTNEAEFYKILVSP